MYVRWLTDSEKYNEWMNPSDYETEEAQEEQEGKRKRDGEDEGEDAKKARGGVCMGRGCVVG